jgi:hypothetical protein
MRRNLPITMAVVAGLVVLADFFVTDPWLDALGQKLVQWAAIVGAFALLLGLVNLFGYHLGRLRARQRGRFYSLVLVISALVVFVGGLVPDLAGPRAPLVDWLFRFVQAPLQATFFSLLAFFVATAAYRAFRVRSFETLLMVGTGLLVLWGQAPISRLLGEWGPAVKDWLLSVPVTAGARGIGLGVALGVVATGLRVLLGFDRPYVE